VVCLYLASKLALPAVSLAADLFHTGNTVRETLEGLAAVNAALMLAGIAAIYLWWMWYRFGYRRLMRKPDDPGESPGSPEDAAEDAG
jgi:hypothetical protein